jgi:hypothetical protein
MKFKILLLSAITSFQTAHAQELFSCKINSRTGSTIELSISSPLETITENPEGFGKNKLQGTLVLNGKEYQLTETVGGDSGGIFGPMNHSGAPADYFPKKLNYTVDVREIRYLFEAAAHFDKNGVITKRTLTFVGESHICN